MRTLGIFPDARGCRQDAPQPHGQWITALALTLQKSKAWWGSTNSSSWPSCRSACEGFQESAASEAAGVAKLPRVFFRAASNKKQRNNPNPLCSTALLCFLSKKTEECPAWCFETFFTISCAWLCSGASWLRFRGDLRPNQRWHGD